MGCRRKAQRDEDEKESGRILRRSARNPSAFRRDIVLAAAGWSSLHMFLEDGAGHPDRPLDLLLLFF